MKIQNGISLAPLPPEAKAAQQDANLREAAKMYEGHFLNEMVKAMRSTVKQEDGFIKPSFAEKIFTEQLDQQYVDGWSKKGGVGLADMIYNQIREQYFGAGKKDIHQLNHMLPIAPKHEPHGIGSPDTIQMKTIPSQQGAKLSYRFEVQDPSTGGYEVQAPMAGKISQVGNLDQGWSVLHLDHGDGLSSELTFPGHVTESGLGQRFEAGQRLGILDPKRPVLAWNLDWS